MDYIDFVDLGATMFVSGLDGPVPPAKVALGPVVARVRCSLRPADHRRRTPALVDGTASQLPVGTPIRAVAGYSPRCRVAVVAGGVTHVYLAQRTVAGQSAPLPCATTSTAVPPVSVSSSS